MIIIAGHTTYVSGGSHDFPNKLIIEDLIDDKANFIYLSHSINSKKFSKIMHYNKGHLIKDYSIFTIKWISLFRYMSEMIINLSMLIIHSFNKEKIIFIGIDPLNALSGVISKSLNLSNFTIFYTADFSEHRFSNALMNRAYLGIDKFCARKVDQVWNVSNRIYQLRKSQGVSSKKNKYVPNAPATTFKKPFNDNCKTPKLVMTGLLEKQLDFHRLFLAFKMLIKKFPNASLTIIGTGSEEKQLKSEVSNLGLNSSVKFLGYLAHDQIISHLRQSNIGLALYNGAWSFNVYGDSLKCREYFACGLPVLTTNTHSTVEDIKKYKAGVVSDFSIQSYHSSIIEIMNNYQLYSNNSWKLGQKYVGFRKKMLRELI